jgi:hypothetical protein
MSHYFVNNAALPDGHHEVHTMGCRCMPVDKSYLGDFESSEDALTEARKDFTKTSTCAKCGDGSRIESSSTTLKLNVARFRSLIGKSP